MADKKSDFFIASVEKAIRDKLKDAMQAYEVSVYGAEAANELHGYNKPLPQTKQGEELVHAVEDAENAYGIPASQKAQITRDILAQAKAETHAHVIEDAALSVSAPMQSEKDAYYRSIYNTLGELENQPGKNQEEVAREKLPPTKAGALLEKEVKDNLSRHGVRRDSPFAREVATAVLDDVREKTLENIVFWDSTDVGAHVKSEMADFANATYKSKLDETVKLDTKAAEALQDAINSAEQHYYGIEPGSPLGDQIRSRLMQIAENKGSEEANEVKSRYHTISDMQDHPQTELAKPGAGGAKQPAAKKSMPDISNL